MTPKLVFLSILTKLLNNRILYFFHSGGKIGHLEDELAILYRAFILPKLYYGINDWGGSNVKDLEKIEIFAKK